MNISDKKQLLRLLMIVFICFNIIKIQAQSVRGIVNLAEYISASDTDATLAVRKALSYCKTTNAKKLVIPKGRYDFWPNQAAERYMFTSNNDEDLKRIVFLLDGFKNFEIDGQNSEFIFHGFLSPFVIMKSKNIKIHNFSIDWFRTFHSEGAILRLDEDGIVLSFSEQYPYKIENGVLAFYGEKKTVYPYGGLLEFDPVKMETAYMASDIWTTSNVPAKEIAPQQIKIFVPHIKGTPGNVMVFEAGTRICPAITISDCYEIQLRDITIYHCGGMGVIAQRSSDLTLDYIQVKPRKGRVVSITADATHFVNCRGRIVMANCLFENQLDDATNIHGVYVQVVKKISDDKIEVALKHPQQFGFDFIKAGDMLELVHSNSLITYAHGRVKSVKRKNKEYSIIQFSASLPKEMLLNDVVAAVNDTPDVYIHDCIIQGNRARGLLLGSRGKILVENNFFHTAGAAILLEGDARFWFEQDGVRNLTIKGNNFKNCNYGIWGDAVIQAKPGIDKEYRRLSKYNQNITIENNTFEIFYHQLISAYSVENLIFRNNLIKHTNAYKTKSPDTQYFSLSDCFNVLIDKN